MTFLITLITTRVISTKLGRRFDYSFISKVPTNSSSGTLGLMRKKNDFAIVSRSPSRTRNEVVFVKVKEM